MKSKCSVETFLGIILSFLCPGSFVHAADVIFLSSETPHFIIRYVRGSAAERDLAAIVENRERSYKVIASRFGVKPGPRITITVYPDRHSTPSGYGTGETQDGDQISVNYYAFSPCYEQTRYGHELTHALSFRLLGRHHSSAFLSEGLAEFMDQSGRDLHRELGSVIHIWGYRPVQRIEDIDLTGSYAEGAYEKRGSFVKYLVESHGWTRFLDFYKRTANIGTGFSAEKFQTFRQTFRNIYGFDLEVAESEWNKLIPLDKTGVPRLSDTNEQEVRDLVMRQDKAATTHDSAAIAAAYDPINKGRIKMFDGNLFYYSTLQGTKIQEVIDLGIKNGPRGLVRTIRQFGDGRVFGIEYYVEKLEYGWKIQNEEWFK